ncbi:hypothetical protein IJ22_17910 [Paenibacillus naphthalenovorans]|uniref:Uncharacterized protein n=1 Tax=Paenibacillus naphthalenovorans TaxID=162209 RepID=A0A0U2W3V7_9BACL|nr:hypothetical protein IJ22_17910 [Paenibacillus naphthalenovorans]
MFWILFYLVTGITILLLLRGYQYFSPPSRLVQINKGTYQFKDYIEMPEWLWRIILTIFWLPYIIALFITIRKHPPF